MKGKSTEVPAPKSSSPPPKWGLENLVFIFLLWTQAAALRKEHWGAGSYKPLTASRMSIYSFNLMYTALSSSLPLVSDPAFPAKFRL